MRRIAVLLALGMVLALPGVAAAADASETERRELTIQSSNCTELTLPECTFVGLNVVEVGTGELCLVILTGLPLDEHTFQVLREESGCTPLNHSDLVFADDLSWARIATTTIDLADCALGPEPPECTPTRTATVVGTASGASRLTRESEIGRHTSEDGCRDVVRQSTQHRTGRGIVSIDGTVYEGEAAILTMTDTAKTRC